MGLSEEELSALMSEDFDLPPMPEQVKIINEILNHIEAGVKNIIVRAPTGAGKSVIGMGVAFVMRLREMSSIYTTSMKQLQSQIASDFKVLSYEEILTSVKGKANYNCHIIKKPDTNEPRTAEDSPCMDSDRRVRFDDLRFIEHFSSYPTVTDHTDIDTSSVRAAKGQIAQYHYEGDRWWSAKATDVKRTCRENGSCPYYATIDRAITSSIILMSLPGYLTWNLTVEDPMSNPFSARDVMIFDECHIMEDWLRATLSLEISEWELSKLFYKAAGVQFSIKDLAKIENGQEVYPQNVVYSVIKRISDICNKSLMDFLEYNYFISSVPQDVNLLEYTKNLIEEKKTKIEPKDPIIKIMALHDKIEKLRQSFSDERSGLAAQVELQKENGVVVNRYIKVSPITFFKGIGDLIYGEHNIFMSATITDYNFFCRMLRLNPSESVLLDIPSTFPPDLSPTYLINCGRITADRERREPEQVRALLAKSIDHILRAFPNEKGLVHTGSFKRTRELKESGLWGDRALWSYSGGGADSFAQHVSADYPSVLFGPNFQEGVDFKYDLARFQIFVKCPFPIVGDPVMEKKQRMYKESFPAYVAQQVLQMKGRTTRRADDWSMTFILDLALWEFIEKNRALFPKEFLQSLRPEFKQWAEELEHLRSL